MWLEVTSILTAVTCAPPAPLICAVSEPDWALTGAPLGTDERACLPACDTSRRRSAAPSARGAEVVANVLAVNEPAATTYVLWGMRRNEPIRLGAFDGVRARLDLRTVSSAQSGLDRYTTFAVSIEPGRQASTKPSQMVALGR